ncbi:hypothetical protein RIF29_06282 [Crotalaria pallida]|uniref:Uncharacterized protein n=1 Tax=Crotalaria pallida TaxID=3830 RepID=A0AAN9PBF4_CROPI
MGKEIVRQESPEHPGLRSRLWLKEDIIQVFKENKGTNKIQIIIWERENDNDIIDFDGKAFKTMEKLKTFIIHGSNFFEKADYFNGDLDNLPNSLRVLEWQQYPFPTLPFGSHPEKLNILKLSRCSLVSLDLFKIDKKFMNMIEIRWIPPNLETLDVRGCESLKYLDLTTSPCLLMRTILIDDCSALEEIRGISSTIQVLTARNCTSLSDSCRKMLLNQELHEEVVGNMLLYLPWSSWIPEWFEHCSTGHSLSFWFRGMFPAVSTCLVIGLESVDCAALHSKLNINGNTVDLQFTFPKKSWPTLDLNAHHIYIFDIKQLKFEDKVDQLVLLENEWNHAKFSFHAYNIYRKPKQLANAQIGLHVLKQESSSMKDIRFTSPYEIERWNDDDVSDSNSTEKSPMCRSTNVKEFMVLISSTEKSKAERQAVKSICKGICRRHN